MASNPELTNSFIENCIQDRIVNWSGENKCTAQTTAERVEIWQRAGSLVVANAGGYDSMGLNHLRGLIQARIIGASYKLGNEAKIDDIYELASSDDIRLIVSVDTNGALEENKSFNIHGAASVRPILDWDTRARTLALQSMGGTCNLVDFITKHGPKACPACAAENCNHSSDTFNIAASGADIVVLKDSGTTTLNRYKNTTFHVIDENEGAFSDILLGEQISTSAIVRRILQEKKQK